MFFTADNFTNILPYKQAELVAKVAEEIIAKSGMPLTGNLYSDGSYINFSTEKERTDTHVLMAIDVAEMGIFAPSKSPIAVERPEESELVKATDDLNRMLARENMNLRSKKND